MPKKLWEISRVEMNEICLKYFTGFKCKECPLQIKKGNDKTCYLELQTELFKAKEKVYELEQFLIDHQNDEIDI